MAKSRAPKFSTETVDGRTLLVAVFRAEGVGQQKAPTNGSRAGPVCFGVRGKGNASNKTF
jgi:hypothetical protein